MKVEVRAASEKACDPKKKRAMTWQKSRADGIMNYRVDV